LWQICHNLRHREDSAMTTLAVIALILLAWLENWLYWHQLRND
jgi:hypothetical protein